MAELTLSIVEIVDFLKLLLKELFVLTTHNVIRLDSNGVGNFWLPTFVQHCVDPLRVCSFSGKRFGSSEGR